MGLFEIEYPGNYLITEDFWYLNQIYFSMFKKTTELQRTDPGKKVTGEFSTKGHISHLMSKMDLYYFHRFSWEKIH